MKKIAIAAAVLASIGASANAQIAFTGMDLTAKFLEPLGTSGGSTYGYGIDGQAVFSSTSFGVQTDFGLQGANSSGSSATEYDVGLHVFSSLSDSFKLGGFYTFDSFNGSGSSIGLTTYGGEALAHFGKLDADFSIAATNGAGILSAINFRATADAYYQINDSFSMNVGASYLKGVGGSLTLYTIGAQYQLANMPLTLGVDLMKPVESGGGSGSGAVQATVSYGFGPHSDGRMFGKRNFNYTGLVLPSF